MAKFTTRQVITTLSVIYLLLLTSLAGYALHRSNALSLPIPNVHAALTLALPPLAGIAVETLTSFHHASASSSSSSSSINQIKNNPLQLSHPVFQTIAAIFLVYETVLATLAGTHIVPLGGSGESGAGSGRGKGGVSWCALHTIWQHLYQQKDAKHIRAIQDILQCCGFASTKDMAWPFPSSSSSPHKGPAGGGGGGGLSSCAARHERDRACWEPWRDEERKVAMMLLVVPVGVFAWKLALFLIPRFSESSWLPSMIRLPAEVSNGRTRAPRHAIMYRDVEQQQQQQQQQEQEGGDDDNSIRQEVNRLNRDSDLASHVEHERRGAREGVASPLIQNNRWMNDQI